MKPQGTLLLLDAHALIHRAYHALPPSFITKKGELVNAVYGFISVLINILKEQKPEYIAAAFDTEEPTFRHKEFREYKAQRPATATDLISQVPKIKEVLKSLGIEILEAPGFEADDIIGVLAKRFSKQTDVLVVTGDLDTLQLINDKVKVLTFKKGVSDTVIYDTEAVKKRFGLEPWQLIDYKALRGDPSDNIPGVSGVGEKTAISLLQQFGSLGNLYKALENSQTEIKESLKNKLLDNKEAAFFSKKLVTLRFDVPLKVKLSDLEFKGLQKQHKFGVLLQEFGFFRLFERLNKEKQNTKVEKPDTIKGTEIKKFEQKDLEILQKAEELIVEFYDDEGLILSVDEKIIFLVSREKLGEVKEVLADSKIKKIGYDLKNIWHGLQKEGIILNGLYFDVMLAAYLLRPGRRDYPLERIIFQELNSADTDSSEPVLRVSYLWEIYEKQKAKLKDNDLDKVFYEIEIPLIVILAKMEKVGIKLEKGFLLSLSKVIKIKLSKLEKNIFKLAGSEFNISSPNQLSSVLFEKMKISTKGLRKTPGGVISTQASELAKLKKEYSVVDLILQYREFSKLKNTYVDALPDLINSKTKRLHTSFVQTGTATGRLSSEEPNLQNIPIRSEMADEIRRAFVAEKGFKLVSFDYSQIELRLAAALAQDVKMTEAFKRGLDIHALTAAEINKVKINEVTGEMRRQAKVLNFGVLYGMGPNAFAQAAGVPREQAKIFIDEYFKDFSGIASYIEKIKDEARRNGFVRTLTGRRRWIPEIHSQNQMVRSQGERIAVNMPIQGSDADINKMSMVAIDKEFGSDNEVRMLLQIHDALLFEIVEDKVKKAVAKIKEIMEQIITLSVPLKVDVRTGTNWAELKTYIL